MKIVLVSCCFGKPVDYFQLWLDSCGFNKSITWILYTDMEANTYDFPENVIHKRTTIPELRAEMQKHVPYPIKYDHAWEFCQFKSSVGAIFRDDVKDADYWGWYDWDMICGDLNLLNVAIALGCDKIMPKGHLGIMRKDIGFNEYMLKHPYTKLALSGGSGVSCYEEELFRSEVVPNYGFREDVSVPFANTACRPGHYKIVDCEALSFMMKPENVEQLPFVATWRDGHMWAHFALPDGTTKVVEIAYFHFFRRRLKPKVLRLEAGKSYLIVPNEIREYDGHALSAAEIRWLDRFRVHWRYFAKRMKFRFLINKFKEKISRNI